MFEINDLDDFWDLSKELINFIVHRHLFRYALKCSARLQRLQLLTKDSEFSSEGEEEDDKAGHEEVFPVGQIPLVYTPAHYHY